MTASKPSEPSTEDSEIPTTVGNGREPAHHATLRDRLDKLFARQAQGAAGGHETAAGADPGTVKQQPVNDDEPAKDSRQEKQSPHASAPIRSNVASIAPEPNGRLDDQQIVHTTAVQQKHSTAVTESNVENGTTANAMTVTMSAPSAEPATPTEEMALMTAAAGPSPAAPTFSVITMANGLLAAAGLGPIAGTSPAAPGVSPLAWAMLAVARRAFGILGNTSAASRAPTSATFASTSAATDASQAVATPPRRQHSSAG